MKFLIPCHRWSLITSKFMLKNPLYLFIDTSFNNQLYIALVNAGNEITDYTYNGDHKVSELLLKSIIQLLEKNRVSLFNLAGILTVIGPGQFTSIRIALAITNTLAVALKIPVCGIKAGLDRQKLIKQGIAKFPKVKSGCLLKPFYNQELNIILKK